jgi:hypothetical protein
MKTSITVNVSKETYELGIGINKVVKAIKDAIEDGFQVGEDIPVIIAAAITELIPAIEGFELIPEELKADRQSFMNAVSLTTSELVETLIG